MNPEKTSADGKFRYKTQNNKVIITGINKNDAINNGELVIPSKIDGNDVAELATGAINQVDELQKISLEGFYNNAIVIKKEAIKDCQNLTQIDLSACDNLTLKQPVFEEAAIAYANTDKEITITAQNKKTWDNIVSQNAIVNDSGYTTVPNIKSPIAKLNPRNIVNEDENLYRLYQDINFNQYYTLVGIKNADEVTIPEQINGIKVKKVAPMAAFNTPNLRKITFPQSIEKIKDGTFYNCPQLNQITITNANCDIESSKLIIPRIRQIVVEAPANSNAQRFAEQSQNAFAFIELGSRKTNEFFEYEKHGNDITITRVIKLDNNDKITIPEQIDGLNVTSINQTAFGDTKIIDNVQSVDIKAKIEKLPPEIFYDCKNLKTLSLPENLKEIGTKAFHNVTKLHELVIPNGIEKIEQDAFEGCRIALVSDSEKVKNYVEGQNNLIEYRTLDENQKVHDDWQVFMGKTAAYQTPIEQDRLEALAKLYTLKSNNPQVTALDDLIAIVKSSPSLNGPKDHAIFRLPSSDTIYKIPIDSGRLPAANRAIDELVKNNILHPLVQQYYVDENVGPEQYEKYLYDLNTKINGVEFAEGTLGYKSPLTNTRTPYDFEYDKNGNIPENSYYQNTYINQYRNNQNNAKKNPFGKKKKRNGQVSDINAPENRSLLGNLKTKFSQFFNKVNTSPQNEKVWSSTKKLRNGIAILALAALGISLAGPVVGSVVGHFGISVAKLPFIIAGGGLANPAVSNALTTALLSLGGLSIVGGIAIKKHLKKKKEQNAQTVQQNNTGTPAQAQTQTQTQTPIIPQSASTPINERQIIYDMLFDMKMAKNSYENACNLPFDTQDKQDRIKLTYDIYQKKLETVADRLMDYFAKHPEEAPQMNMGGRTI